MDAHAASKKDTLVLTLLTLWAATLLYFLPRILAFLVGPEPLFAKLIVIAFAATLSIIWLYTLYHLVHFHFSRSTILPLVIPDRDLEAERSGGDGDHRESPLFCHPAARPRDPEIMNKYPGFRFESDPELDFQVTLEAAGVSRSRASERSSEHGILTPTALLYMTCNDFREDAATTCLHQDHGDYHVFICDDSTDPEYQKTVDDFAANHKTKVTVYRRQTRAGYKAGNINHALSRLPQHFSQVFVSDADSVLPQSLLSALSRELQTDPRLAFVQASQREAATQPSAFARVLGFNTNLHWQHYMPAKNDYGFVMFYGHGALLRRAAINDIGAFPEVATEDLAFSMLCRARGWYGRVLDTATSQEEFPKDLAAFRRRNRKWVRGTLECLFRFLPGFLKAKNISTVEKIDLVISGGSLLQALPLVLFLVLVGLGLPFFYGDYFSYGPMHYLPPLAPERWIERLLRLKFWKFDFFCMMMAAIFAPLLPVMLRLAKEPRRMTAYMFLSAFTYLSTTLDTFKEAIAYLFTRRAEFYTTGDSTLKTETVPGLLFEGLAGAAFLVLAFTFTNIWILAAGLAFLLTPAAVWIGLDNRLMKLAAQVPFAICLYMAFMITAAIL